MTIFMLTLAGGGARRSDPCWNRSSEETGSQADVRRAGTSLPELEPSAQKSRWTIIAIKNVGTTDNDEWRCRNAPWRVNLPVNRVPSQAITYSCTYNIKVCTDILINHHYWGALALLPLLCPWTSFLRSFYNCREMAEWGKENGGEGRWQHTVDRASLPQC